MKNSVSFWITLVLIMMSFGVVVWIATRPPTGMAFVALPTPVLPEDSITLDSIYIELSDGRLYVRDKSDVDIYLVAYPTKRIINITYFKLGYIVTFGEINYQVLQ